MHLIISLLASLSVLAFGAKGDGTTLDTKAIQAAVDAAYAQGGGVVELPAGTYLSGTIYLRDNIELHICEGATIKGSPSIEDYCAADCYPQNWASGKDGDNTSGGHLIVGVGLRNVAITGPGAIDGNSEAFLLDSNGVLWPSKKAIPVRPSQMVWFADCSGIRIEGVEMSNSPYWTCFILNCDWVWIRDCYVHTERRKFHTYNGDGFDIDRSQHVLISGCRIDTADDCITLRASCGKLLERPQDCAYVYVTGCGISSSCNAIRVGVGEGAIHDAYFSDIDISDSGTAFNYVAAYGKTSRGTDIHDIRTYDVRVEAKCFLKMHHMYSREAEFSDILFEGVSGSTEQKAIIRAWHEHPFRNIVMKDVELPLGYEAVNAEVAVDGGSFPEMQLSEEKRRQIEEDMAAFKHLLH